ncbi:MAG: cation:proton antiporter [Candidatus Cloacimonetes bacterium]|nr:cation:proton antiporter [Candidatus Cloacimonadota bacterium]
MSNLFSSLSMLTIVGFIAVGGYYFGRNMQHLRLPSIIGFMIFGAILGPSLLNLLTEVKIDSLGFIPDIALGFVALSIGMELKLSSLKKLGKSIIYIILLESFGAFLLVFGSLYLLTGDVVLSLLFGAIAPASAPAGTVAVIKEYKAKGSLTKALYAVVGFDDGLGIIIFGFAMAFAQSMLAQQAGQESTSLLTTILEPMKEVGLSVVIGGVFAGIFILLAHKIAHADDLLILIFGFTLMICGTCTQLHLSLILTNMVMGMIVVNTQPNSFVARIQSRLTMILPLLFILFFTVAGANLHVRALPSLGFIGIVYVLSRSAGLIGGARLGAIIGKANPHIKNYIGLGILSQAGVAIGLSLMVKQNLKTAGPLVDASSTMHVGEQMGGIIITTITATCIFFEIIGPILTKIALKKAGEIQ